MSHPVTDADIDDVLASIRRLVMDGSGEDRPATVIEAVSSDPALRAAGRPEPVAPGRLILTQALRVSKWGVTGCDGLVRNAAASPAFGPTTDAAAVRSRLDRAEEAPRASGSTRSVGPLLLTTPVGVIPAPLSPAARLAVGIEAAVTERNDEWEPDGSEAEGLHWSLGDGRDPLIFRSRLHGARIDTAAALREVARPAPDEPSSFRSDVPSEVEMPLIAATDPRAGMLRHAMTGAETGEASSDLLLDEEALRTLVTDVVRQELQGALGERITRNVRKLVRREIYRVLASKDDD